MILLRLVTKSVTKSVTSCFKTATHAHISPHFVCGTRRNLTDGWKYELAQTKKKLLEDKGRENLKKPTGGKKSLTLSINDKVNTQKAISEDLGWSTGKVASVVMFGK